MGKRNFVFLFFVLILAVMNTTYPTSATFESDYVYPTIFEYGDSRRDTKDNVLQDYDATSAGHKINAVNHGAIDLTQLRYEYDLDTGMFEMSARFRDTPKLNDYIEFNYNIEFRLNHSADIHINYYKGALPEDVGVISRVVLINEPSNFDDRVVIDVQITEPLIIEGDNYKLTLDLDSMIGDHIDLGELFFPSIQRYWRPADYNHPKAYASIEDRYDLAEFGWYSFYDDETYHDHDTESSVGRITSIYWPLLLIMFVVTIIYRYRTPIKTYLRKTEKETTR